MEIIDARTLSALALASFAAFVIGWDLPTRTFVFLTTFWAFSPSIRIVKEIK